MTTWNRHHIDGFEIDGHKRAEVLGTVTHQLSGKRGISIRYEDFPAPLFVPESDLRARPEYTAARD